MDNDVNLIWEKYQYITELFESIYPFQRPQNFYDDEVFYSFDVDGIQVKVQFSSELAEPVLENNNDIKVAFGKPLKTPYGWIKVETEELLNVSNPMKVISTVFNGILVDFIKTYFKDNIDKKISITFHGSLTQQEIDKDIPLEKSKRSRIYLNILKRMTILKEYGLSVYTLGEDGIEISNI